MLDKEASDKIIGKFVAVSALFFILFLYSFITKSEKAKKYATVTNYLIVLFTVMAAYFIPHLMKEEYKPWNPQETTEIKSKFISEIRKLDYPLYPQQEQQIVDCSLDKTKSKYPNGGKSDTLGMYAFLYKTGKDCIAATIENAKLNGWTKTFEDDMFNTLYNNPDMVKIYTDNGKRSRASRCCLEKLKSTYPNGIDFKDLKLKIDTIYKDCFK